MTDLTHHSPSPIIHRVLRAIKFRIYPTRLQASRLHSYIDASRRIYNKALEQRIHAVNSKGKGINYYDQQKQLTLQRAVQPDIREIPVEVERDGLRRVDSAFKHFFRRCKEGAKKKGFPRFKCAARYNSFTVTAATDFIHDGRVRVPGMKSMRCRGVQPFDGKQKRLTITRKAGKWLGRVLVDDGIEPPVIRPIRKAVGIDVGLNSFIATSDGNTVECPKHYRRLESRLARANKLVSRRSKGSSRRKKAILNLQRIHQKIENCRDDFSHKLSKRIVAEYDLIFTEKLNIRGMVRSRLAKSIMDAAWSKFNWQLQYKAEKAGVLFAQVNARGTSQECSQCGQIVFKTLSDRVHGCSCGCVLDRDVNASRNVLKRGLQSTVSTPVAASVCNARRELTATDGNGSCQQVGSVKRVDSLAH